MLYFKIRFFRSESYPRLPTWPPPLVSTAGQPECADEGFDPDPTTSSWFEFSEVGF